jgi:hypothetical protein
MSEDEDPAIEAVMRMMFGYTTGTGPSRMARRIVEAVDEARREAARTRPPSGLAAIESKIVQD